MIADADPRPSTDPEAQPREVARVRAKRIGGPAMLAWRGGAMPDAWRSTWREDTYRRAVADRRAACGLEVRGAVTRAAIRGVRALRAAGWTADDIARALEVLP